MVCGMCSSAKHTLYLVATPIGNRDDLSARAITTLRCVERIYAEDTRHSAPLLRHHGITTRLWSLHEHNEAARVDEILAFLHDGGCAALISDAGTPLISDPGYRLVRACLQAQLCVSPVPGPSALTAALSICGLPTDRFTYAGFPPARRAARRQWLAPLLAEPVSLVLYESPHRIVATLEDLQTMAGAAREITLARELTKRYESILHGSISEVLAATQADAQRQRGEFVLVVAGADATLSEDNASLDRLLEVLLKHLPLGTASRCAAELQGISRKQAYDRGLQLRARSAGTRSSR